MESHSGTRIACRLHHLNGFGCPRMASLEVNFQSREEEKVMTRQKLVCWYPIRSSLIQFSSCAWTFCELSVKVLTHSSTFRHKLFVYDSIAIKKANQHFFDHCAVHSCFFAIWRGEIYYSISWRLVSGSYSNTKLFPDVVLLLQFFGTIFEEIFLIPNSLIKIWW